MEDSDGELVARYREGDILSLEKLVDRYRRRLFGFILNMSGGSDEADDLFQEVWLRAIRKIASYRDSNFPAWLMRIARNLVIDRRRSRKPAISLDLDNGEGASLAEKIPGNSPDPAREAGDKEMRRRMAEAIADLPPEQEEVVLLRVNAELSFREIAKVQGISINTALARMQYAISKLRKTVQCD